MVCSRNSDFYHGASDILEHTIIITDHFLNTLLQVIMLSCTCQASTLKQARLPVTGKTTGRTSDFAMAQDRRDK